MKGNNIIKINYFSALSQKFGGKIPDGLVTKNATPGYEMVRVGGSQGPGGMAPPGFQNQSSNLLGPNAANMPFPFNPNMLAAGFNPAALLQCELTASTSNELFIFLVICFSAAWSISFHQFHQFHTIFSTLITKS